MKRFYALLPAPGVKVRIWMVFIVICCLCSFKAQATSYTSIATGNWSSSATWSPVGVPGGSDNVTISGAYTVTIDGVDSVNNLILGGTAANSTLQITSAGNSLKIIGALSINPNSYSNTYTLNAGPGTINVAGTFPTWCSTIGTNAIKVSTGTLTFAPAITISTTHQAITNTGAGTINFNSSFTDDVNGLTTIAGCIVNFAASYTVNTTYANWAGKGTANFTGSSSTITANSNLTLYNLQTAASSGLTLASAAGTVIIGGAVTLGSSSTFTASENFELDGNWTNSGGTFSGGTNTVDLNGTNTITGATAFPILQIGSTGTAVTVSVMLDNSITCTGLTVTGNTLARTVTISGGDTLTVNGNAAINIPTAARTNSLLVNTGTCIITGNLNLIGTDSVATYVSKVAVTTGLLSVAGTVSYANNILAANQVITLTSNGTITFGSPLNMAYGTLSSTSTGTINFNGSTPSFTFGGSNTPSFSVTGSSTLNVVHGFINNTNALTTIAAGSTCYFTGNGTITGNAGITFGNVQFNGSDTLALTGNAIDIAGSCTLASGSLFNALQNFELDGNWTNSGGTFAGGANTIDLNGTNTITGATAFANLQIGSTGTAVAVSVTLNNSITCTGLTVTGNTLARTLTISGGDTLTVSGNAAINIPTAVNKTNSLLVNTGTCIITGNLNFIGTDSAANYISKVAVTTGLLNVAGTVNYAGNILAANQVITLTSTGTITFGSPLNMAYGTLSGTSTGTINFNGSSPSFTFGGSNTPSFSITGNSALNFAHGFINNTSALTTIAAGSTCYFTGNGSITPNANITFGNVQLDSLVLDTLNTAAGTAVVAGSFTLLYGSVLTANQPYEMRGNWINDGGTITSTSNPIIMNGVGQNIEGSATTVFPILQMGDVANPLTVTCTVNANITVDSLVFNGYTKARTLTVASGTTLTVNGNLNINQPTAAAINTLAVSAGTCTVRGNLNFIGTTSTNSYVGKVAVTSGSFSLTGNVNWMSNTTVATEVITVSTGTITFAKSLTMGTGSGNLTVTGTGTVNFNGTTAPSFNFGGAATAPAFTTTAGCTLNFAKGFTNNTTKLIIKAGSNTYFTGSGSITPNAAITFGNVYVNASVNDTLVSAGGVVIMTGNFSMASGSVFYAEQNFEVDGNWTNTSATLSGTTYTVFLNGPSQTVSGSPTTFQTLEIGNTTTAVNVTETMTCNNTCSALIFLGSTLSRTLALNSGITLTVNGNLTINQPTGNSETNLLQVGPATCNVSGNLVYSGTNTSVTRICQVGITSGTFNLTGNVTWGGSTSTAVNVISVSTGTVNFGSSIAMGTKSGTMNVTGSGEINFNGTTAPSLTFGGAIAPVFNSTSGCVITVKDGITTNTTPLTFANGSNVVFTGTGSLTPNAAVSFGNIQISKSDVLTAAGNISVTGNWVDSGSFTPSTSSVTFNGSGTQTIFNSSGSETFYQLSATTSGSITELLGNVMVTNAFTMGGANINMNNYTLTLGNSAGASLSYIAGIAYGGTWKRWFPASAISDSSGAYYGLFPIGTSTAYRYVDINSTANPTTAGYVSATHTDATGVTIVHYVDNGGSLIEEIGNMHTDLSTSGLAGGTYNIQVHFTGFSTSGNVSDLVLETYTGNAMGSCGTFVVPIGPATSPTVGRSGITAANIANRWVIGTDNEASTPLYAFYTSRKTGNWNDATPGNGTWSLSSDTTASSCNCVPISGSFVIIDSATTVTLNTKDSVDFIDVNNDGKLIINSGDTLVVLGNMTLFGTGTFTNSGTILTYGDLTLPSANSVTSTGTINVTYDIIIPAGGVYNQSGGSLTASGNLDDTGTINIASGGTLYLNGNAAIIDGTGTINDSAGTIVITNHKSITAGSSFTFGTSTANTTVNIASGTTVSSSGSVTLNGGLTGASSSSTWVNNANSTLNITGALLATGSLDAATGPNTVNYSGSGSQTINAPVTAYYNLDASNSGTKSLSVAAIANDSVTISGSAILNEGTNALTGPASLNMTGTSELELQRTVEGTYPELTGPYTLSAGTVVLNQTGDSAILSPATYYNLTLNGTRAYDISGIPTISGNLSMSDTAILNNNNELIIDGTFTYSSNGYTTLQDDITANGVTITAGTLDDGGNNITIAGAGGWTMNAGNFNSSGQTFFSPKIPVAQTIGGSSPTTFYDLVINNTGQTVTLNVSPAATTQISGYLELDAGNIVTNSANILLMQDTATVVNGSAASYVCGPMIKQGNTSFVFPIGKGGIYGQAGISGGVNTATQVTAEFFPAAYSTLTPLASNLNQVSATEYWMIERTVTSDSLQVQLFWTDALLSNILSCSYLTIAHYTGGQWINQGATTIGGSVCSGAGSGSIQTNGYVSTFSPFTFGSDDGGEALPVTLVSFNATPQGKIVQTQWTTDLEINNAYFTVERSADAINFSEIAQVAGAGNSTSVLNYTAQDENPLTGVSYYRLKQTDFNGHSTYSDVVSVNRVAASAITIYPNPASGQWSLTLTNPSGVSTVNIFDLTGREVYSQTIEAQPNSTTQTIPFNTTGILTSGVYIVSVNSGGGTVQEKLVVK